MVAFLRIVAIFAFLGPLVFTLVAMLLLAAFVLFVEPRNLGDVATLSVGAVVIAYIFGLLPAAGVGFIVALRHIVFAGAGPLLAALTGSGAAAIVLAAWLARLGGRLLVRQPAIPVLLIVSAAAASLVCWWIAIGRCRSRREAAP